MKMINSFKQYLIEEENTVYFTFGRMNPPTIGHEKLVNSLAKAAGKFPYRVYLSHTNDKKKNPLKYSDKIKYSRKMFPKHARFIINAPKLKNVLAVASSMHDEGIKNITLVVGSDRVQEFKALLTTYNGKDGRHGFYNFKTINVISAGERDPDAEGVTGMSASKMRAAAADNNFTAFSQGLPKNFSNKDSKDLFNAVRNGMGLKEQTEFTKHLELKRVSDLREKYVEGELFANGERVLHTKTNEEVSIMHKGSNYLILEREDGSVFRAWLDSVQKLDEWVCGQCMAEPCTCESIEEAAKPRWKKAGPNGEIEITVNGQRYKIEKALDHNERHRGEFKIMVWDKRSRDWEWDNTVQGKAYAKELVMDKLDEKTSSRQDSDIKDREGSQPAGYFKGIKSKSTKIARDQHFKRNAKKDDDDPSAYKKAPGDATAKTKPSKHTLKFKKMFGEDAIAAAKSKIEREKKQDAVKHDRMLDRARLARARAKNRKTKP